MTHFGEGWECVTPSLQALSQSPWHTPQAGALVQVARIRVLSIWLDGFRSAVHLWLCFNIYSPCLPSSLSIYHLSERQEGQRREIERKREREQASIYQFILQMTNSQSWTWNYTLVSHMDGRAIVFQLSFAACLDTLARAPTGTLIGEARVTSSNLTFCSTMPSHLLIPFTGIGLRQEGESV